jgi:hypothetical protein
MTESKNQIYARTDGTGTVVRFFSSVFETPTPSDIFIEEGDEDYHAHVHLKYDLVDEDGRYNYSIVDGQLTLIPDEDKPPIPDPPEPGLTLTEVTDLLNTILGVTE